MYGRTLDASDVHFENPLRYTYEIEALLGSGGCGSVYKAWHKRLRKHMVLKQLKDSSQKAIAVRRNEIEALKNIKSMFIPQVFDFITDKDNSITVMEYIEGENPEELLREGTIFSLKQVAKWYYQLATALETLHGNGVCHRDIKPGNIIIRSNGDACLIDFNSALVEGNNTGVINRSMGYASPEQYSYFQMCQEVLCKHKRPGYQKQTNNAVIDWKLSDIYSLGATMYHFLTGNRPAPKPDTDAEMLIISENMSDVGSIIERSMRVCPQERYKSAHELRIALLQSRTYMHGTRPEHLPL